MMRAALAISGLLLITPQAAIGQERGTEPYDLAAATIRALASVSSARDTLARVSAKADSLTVTFDAILANRKAAYRCRDAAMAVSPFLGSKDDLIREAAEHLKSTSELLALRLNASAESWERFAKATTAQEIQAQVPDAAKRAAELDETWRMLPLVVGFVSHALVDDQRQSPEGSSRI